MILRVFVVFFFLLSTIQKRKEEHHPQPSPNIQYTDQNYPPYHPARFHHLDSPRLTLSLSLSLSSSRVMTVKSKTHPAVELVKKHLEAAMKPDPVTAASFLSPDIRITFTGKRVMPNAQAVAAFNASRYKWVKKEFGQFDWMERDDHVVVYSNGFLYGEWPDGRSFSGNRFLDRFEVKDEKIVRADVWNDSAEWILTPELNQSSDDAVP
jgi:hypothetical protein